MTTDSFDRTRLILHQGLGPDELDEVRSLLGAPEGATDAALARALMQQLWAQQENDLALGLPRPSFQGTSEDQLDGRPSAADSSFLGRLSTKAAPTGMDVASLNNPDTVCAVALAGTLRQRRGAVLRLSSLILEGKKRDLKHAMEFLGSLRDVELTYELTEARSRLAGAPGKSARAELERVDRKGRKLRIAVQRYWDGDSDREPLARLLSEERAYLFVRLRSLPDPVVAHVGSILERRGTETSQRLDLLTSLRHAGDVRLTTRLIALLTDADAVVAAEAARVLAATEDSRAVAALRAAYLRSVDDRHRMVVAGALLAHDDAIGVESLEDGLSRGDPELIRVALEGLSELSTVDDSERIRNVANHEDPRVRRQAIRTLGRVGAGRALSWLHKHGPAMATGALRAELEEAERAIVARLELLGEEAPVPRPHKPPAKASLRPKTPGAPLLKRLSARWYYLSGWSWWLLGGVARSVRRFERAAKIYPRWILPYLAVGRVQVRRGEHAQALASFRRALDADRAQVERRPLTMRALTMSFLRRSTELEEAGRADIARGLLEEVLAIDLRNAPSAIRFELQRRHEAHRRRALPAPQGTRVRS